MASQPIWTAHQANAHWYARTTKADLLDAAVELLTRYEGSQTYETIKARIKECARLGKARCGRSR